MASTTSMRAATVILFLALAFAGDRLLGLAAKSAVEASQFRLSQLYRGSVDADIAIFGNSRGVHSLFAPRLAETTCRPVFNGAYNGFSAVSMSLTFKDYLERNRRPKVALVELTASAAWIRSGLELKTFAPLSPRLTHFFEGVARNYRYWTRLTHLYHFNTEIFLRCLFYLHHDDQDWIIEGRQITPDMIREYGGVAASNIDGSERRLTSLRNMAAAAREAGVQLIFYVAPYHRVAFESTPELQPWLDQQRSAIGADAPILDFSHAFPGDEEFADALHLNKVGSYRFIDALLKTPEGQSLSQCDRSPPAGR